MRGQARLENSAKRTFVVIYGKVRSRLAILWFVPELFLFVWE